jgi:hypothetical protein
MNDKTKTWAKRGGIAAGVWVLLSLVPLPRTNPPETAPLQAPAEVTEILDRACADCHSHRTEWPWYAYVAPVNLLVWHDVDEGREYMNLSTWGEQSDAERRHTLQDVVEVVHEGEMPLWIYLPTHPEARLSDADKKTLVAWAKAEKAT